MVLHIMQVKINVIGPLGSEIVKKETNVLTGNITGLYTLLVNLIINSNYPLMPSLVFLDLFCLFS